MRPNLSMAELDLADMVCYVAEMQFFKLKKCDRYGCGRIFLWQS